MLACKTLVVGFAGLDQNSCQQDGQTQHQPEGQLGAHLDGALQATEEEEEGIWNLFLDLKRGIIWSFILFYSFGSRLFFPAQTFVTKGLKPTHTFSGS